MRIAYSIITAALLCGFASAAGSSAIAIVNGYAIDFHEVAVFMERRRAEVVQHYRDTYHAEYIAGFWTNTFGNTTPRTMLRELAIGDAVRMKLLIASGVSLGIIRDTSYDTLDRERLAENKRRASLIQSNRVVYGPAELDVYGFMRYTADRIINERRRRGTWNTEAFEQSIKSAVIIKSEACNALTENTTTR